MNFGRLLSVAAAGALGLAGCVPSYPVEALTGQLDCSNKDGLRVASQVIQLEGVRVTLGGYPAQDLVRLPGGTWVLSGFWLEDQLVVEGEPVGIRTGSDIFKAEATFRATKEGESVEVSVGCTDAK